MIRRISQSWSIAVLSELSLQIAVVVLLEFDEHLILNGRRHVLYLRVVDGEEPLISLVDHELALSQLKGPKAVAIDTLTGLSEFSLLLLFLHL